MSLIAALEDDLEEMYRDPRTERDQAHFDNFVRSLRRYEQECDRTRGAERRSSEPEVPRMARFAGSKPKPPQPPQGMAQTEIRPERIADLQHRLSQLPDYNDQARVLIERLGRGLEKLQNAELFLTNEEEQRLEAHWVKLHDQLRDLEDANWHAVVALKVLWDHSTATEKEPLQDQAAHYGGPAAAFRLGWPRAEYHRLMDRAAAIGLPVAPLPKRSIVA